MVDPAFFRQFQAGFENAPDRQQHLAIGAHYGVPQRPAITRGMGDAIGNQLSCHHLDLNALSSACPELQPLYQSICLQNWASSKACLSASLLCDVVDSLIILNVEHGDPRHWRLIFEQHRTDFGIGARMVTAPYQGGYSAPQQMMLESCLTVRALERPRLEKISGTVNDHAVHVSRLIHLHRNGNGQRELIIGAIDNTVSRPIRGGAVEGNTWKGEQIGNLQHDRVRPPIG